jgi:hypothetical protein
MKAILFYYLLLSFFLVLHLMEAIKLYTKAFTQLISYRNFMVYCQVIQILLGFHRMNSQV